MITEVFGPLAHDVSHDTTGMETAVTAGTTVLTLKGALPVEALRAGDRVITRDGARELLALREVATPRMVRVSASAIGVEQPEEDMVIAAQSRILVRDWRAKALKGCDQAVIEASRLVDGEYIRFEETSPARFYALDFAAPVVIYAGGLELAIAPVSEPA